MPISENFSLLLTNFNKILNNAEFYENSSDGNDKKKIFRKKSLNSKTFRIFFFKKKNRNLNVEFSLKSILMHNFEIPGYISISLTVSS